MTRSSTPNSVGKAQTERMRQVAESSARQVLDDPGSSWRRWARAWLVVHRRKLILCAWFALLLSVVGGYAGWRYVDYRITLRDLRASGYEAMEAEAYAKAVRRFQRYITSRPEDTGALHALAEAQLAVAGRDQRGLLEAVGTLEHLLALEPEHYAAKRSLLRVYWRLGYQEEAEELADDMVIRYPRDPLPFQVLVDLALAAGNEARVTELAGNVLAGEVVPAELRDPALLAMARAEMNRNSPVQAMEWIERCLKVAPENMQAQYQYLNLCKYVDRSPQATLRPAQALFEQSPDKVAHGLLLAAAHRAAADRAQRDGDLEGADAYTQKARDTLTAMVDRELAPAQLRLLLEELNRSGAEQDALALLGDQAGREDAPWVIREYAHRCIVTGKHQLAAQRLRDVIAEKGQAEADSELIALLALAEHARGNVAEVLAAVKQLQGRAYETEAKAWLAFLATQRVAGLSPPARQQRVDRLRAAVKEGSYSPFLLSTLGSDVIQLGYRAEGRTLLMRAAARGLYWSRPLALLADQFIQDGRGRDGYRLALQALRRDPTDFLAQRVYLKAVVANVESLPVEHIRAITEQTAVDAEVAAEGRLDFQAWLLTQCRILLHLREGQPQEAAKRLAKAADAAERDGRADRLLELARIAYRIDPPLGQSLLRRARDVEPDSASLVAAVAGIRARQEGRLAALAYFTKHRDQTAAGEGIDWAIEWARLLEATDDPRAYAAWWDLTKAHPGNLAVIQAMANSNLVLNDKQLSGKLSSGLETAAERTADIPLIIQVRSQLLHSLDAQRRRAAVDRLERMIRAYPATTSQQARTTLATTRALEGNYRGEVELLASMIQGADVGPQIFIRLSKRLLALGEEEQAIAVLDRLALRSGPNRLQRAKAAAQQLAAMGRANRALAILRAVYEDSDAEAADPQLGDLYLELGQTAQAIAVAEQLAADADAATLIQAAELYRAAGDLDRADALVDRVMKMAEEDDRGATHLALGRDLASRGKFKQAIPWLHRAARQGGGDLGRWRLLLEISLLHGSMDQTIVFADEAGLAVEVEGAFDVIKENRQLVERALSSGTARELVPLLLHGSHLHADVLTAIEALAELEAAEWSGTQMLPTLKRLLAATDPHPGLIELQNAAFNALALCGQYEQAATRVDRMLFVHPDRADPAAFAARFMAEYDQDEAAARYAKIWRSRVGRSEAADRLLINVLVKGRRADEVVTRLAPFLRTVEADPAARPELTAHVARKMIRAGRNSWVERWLLPWANRSNKGLETWCGLAAEMPTAEAAEAWLLRVGHAADADRLRRLIVANAGHAVGLRFDKEVLLKESSAEMSSLLRATPDDLRVLNIAGICAHERGDLDTAVALFRRAYELQPQSPQLANNFAQVLLDADRVEEALPLARFAVRALPRAGQARDTLANALFRRGELEEAALQSRLATWNAPNDLVVRLSRVRILRQVEGEEAARAELAAIRRRIAIMERRSAANMEALEALEAELNPSQSIDTNKALTRD